MVERLDDQGGMSLPQRFVMYVDLLVQLVRLLSRQVYFLPNPLIGQFLILADRRSAPLSTTQQPWNYYV